MAGGGASFIIAAQTGCPWNVRGAPAWVNITSAAFALVFAADNSLAVLPTYTCSGTPAACKTSPGESGSCRDAGFLSLYGTGIRGVSSASAVSVTLGAAWPFRWSERALNPPIQDSIELRVGGPFSGGSGRSRSHCFDRRDCCQVCAGEYSVTQFGHEWMNYYRPELLLARESY